MLNNLTNYPQIKLDIRYKVSNKHTFLVHFSLIAFLVLISSVYSLSYSFKSSGIDNIKQKNAALYMHVSKSSKDFLGVIKNSKMRSMQGFYPYLHYLATFQVENAWIKDITINFDKNSMVILGRALRVDAAKIYMENLSKPDSPFKTAVLLSARTSKYKMKTVEKSVKLPTTGRVINVKKDVVDKSQRSKFYTFELKWRI